MANNIRIKRSAVPGKVPATADLALGELAVNTYDGLLYVKQDTTSTGGSETVVPLGARGYTGSKGDIGYTGSAGVDGTSIKILGNVATSTSLPGYPSSYTGSAGDSYLTIDTGHLWTWSGSAWTDVGTIQGPIGYTGSQGTTGYAGSQGIQGVIGYTGSKGDQGVIGYTGSKGDIGYTGSKGADGGQLTAGSYVVKAVKNGSTQTITSGSDIVVTLVDDFDPQNWWSENKFQPTIAGYYSINTQVWWEAGVVNNNQTNTQLRKNGTTQIAIAQNPIANTTIGYFQSISTIVYFNGSTDYVEVTVYTANTTSQNIAPSANGTWFTAALYAYGPQGYTGSKGDIGYSGSQGVIGYTGSQGIQGVIGYTGSKGDQGVIGYTGSKGDQGVIGYTGSKGDIGYTGSQGIQGVIGYTGSKGDQGVIGYTGSQGVQGVIGYTGSQGTQGVIGYTGSQGIQGVIGYTGSQGIQGVIGYTGSKGDQGVIGYTGSQGIQGIIGYTGSQGIQGIIGYTGSLGYTGSQGTIGYTGSIGATGYTGSGATVTSSDTAPSTPIENQLWWDSNVGNLRIYYNDGDTSQWVDAVALQTGYTGSKGDIGYTGSAGPSNIINATDDAMSTTLYPVLVNAAGSDQTAKASVGNLLFNSSAGTLTTNNLVLNGNLTVGGTTTTVNTATLEVHDNMIYLNAEVEATITNAVGNGTYVTYTAANSFQPGMSIRVTGVSPSQYNISFTDAKTIFAANSTQFVVASTATGSYSSGGLASARVAANPDIGFAAGYYDGSYHHTGLFRDATDGVYKFFKNYDPEPDATVYIDVSDPSFAFADVQVGALKSVTLDVAGYGQVINSSGQWVGPNSGLIGYTGSQGVIGYTGSAGTNGYTGSQGIIGYTGSQGIQGVIGYTGSQGIQGVIGYTGSQGIQGVIGYTGSQGIQGNLGYTGSQGIQGDIGYTGSAGTNGYTGSAGTNGYTGSLGYTGSAGPSNVLNATATTTSQTTYLVGVTAAGSNQTPFVSTTNAVYFNPSTGSFYATSKSFRIKHPTKEGMILTYGSLEGPENGVYVRGRLKDGNVIQLPEYWTKLIDPNTITVELTPVGKYQKLFVKEIKDNTVTIGNDAMFTNAVDCFYTVYGERCDVAKMEVESY